MKIKKWKISLPIFGMLTVSASVISACSQTETTEVQKNHFTSPDDQIRKQQNLKLLQKMNFSEPHNFVNYEQRVLSSWKDYAKEEDTQKKHDLYYPGYSWGRGGVKISIEGYTSDFTFNAKYSSSKPTIFKEDKYDVLPRDDFDTIGYWFDYDYIYGEYDEKGNLLSLWIHAITLQDAKYVKIGHNVEIEKNPDTLATRNHVLMYTFTTPQAVN